MLLTDAGEVDDRLGLLAGPGDVDDHALAERRMSDVVTDPETEVLRIGRLRGLPARRAASTTRSGARLRRGCRRVPRRRDAAIGRRIA